MIKWLAYIINIVWIKKPSPMIGEGESFSPFGRTKETKRYAQTIVA